jgi:hypothetical protein
LRRGLQGQNFVIGVAGFGQNSISVLADARGGTADACRGAIEACGRPGLTHAAERRLVQQFDQFVVDDLGLVHHLGAPEDGGARHICRVQAIQPLLAVSRRQDLGDQGQPVRGVPRSRGGRPEARVVDPVRTVDDFAESSPFGIGERSDGDVAIQSLEDQVRAWRRLGRVFLPDNGVLRHCLGP